MPTTSAISARILLLADVDRAVADPLDRPRDDDHAQPPLAQLGLGHDVHEALDEAPVGAVDQLVELDEALRAVQIAARERVERDPEHLLGPVTHLAEHVDEVGIGLDVRDELRELADGDTAVCGPLEQEIDVEDREQQRECVEGVAGMDCGCPPGEAGGSRKPFGHEVAFRQQRIGIAIGAIAEKAHLAFDFAVFRHLVADEQMR